MSRTMAESDITQRDIGDPGFIGSANWNGRAGPRRLHIYFGPVLLGKWLYDKPYVEDSITTGRG